MFYYPSYRKGQLLSGAGGRCCKDPAYACTSTRRRIQLVLYPPLGTVSDSASADDDSKETCGRGSIKDNEHNRSKRRRLGIPARGLYSLATHHQGWMTALHRRDFEKNEAKRIEDRTRLLEENLPDLVAYVSRHVTTCLHFVSSPLEELKRSGASRAALA